MNNMTFNILGWISNTSKESLNEYTFLGKHYLPVLEINPGNHNIAYYFMTDSGLRSTLNDCPLSMADNYPACLCADCGTPILEESMIFRGPMRICYNCSLGENG